MRRSSPHTTSNKTPTQHFNQPLPTTTSDMMASSQLTEFHLFPKLAPEIRLIIWHHAAPLFPCVVAATPLSEYQRDIGDIFPCSRWQSTPSGIAMLLSVNREVRNELLPSYNFRFTNYEPKLQKGTRAPPPLAPSTCASILTLTSLSSMSRRFSGLSMYLSR